MSSLAEFLDSVSLKYENLLSERTATVFEKES